MYDAYNEKLPNRVQVLALKYVIFILCIILLSKLPYTCL